MGNKQFSANGCRLIVGLVVLLWIGFVLVIMELIKNA